MTTGKVSPWLWLALILDIPIMARPFWQAAKQISILLPYRSVTDWVSDPIWVLSAVFECLGFIGVIMAFLGDRRALLFWNLCHLILGLTVSFSLSMNMAEVLIRFTTSPEPLILIAASVLATVAAFLANRQIQIPIYQ